MSEILNRQIEYCFYAYNIETDGGPTVLVFQQIPDKECPSILQEDWESVVEALKTKKPDGVDNIPAGGDAMADILTSVCNKILKTGTWSTDWNKSLVTVLAKSGNEQLCQRTVSLISHINKAMLNIVSNSLQQEVERTSQKCNLVSEQEGAT